MSKAAKRWRRISGEWEQSGECQGAFCRRRGESVAALRWWRWRLGLTGSTRRSNGGSGGDFVAVRVVEAPRLTNVEGAPAAPLIELACRGGRVLRLVGGVDVDLVARLVTALETCS